MKEARVASHPISSPHALFDEKKGTRDLDHKSAPKAKVLATSSVAKDTFKASNKTVACEYCGNLKHRIHKCEEFVKESIERRQSFAKEKNICFECLTKNHFKKIAKVSIHAKFAKRSIHPTCLHDDRLNQTSIDQHTRSSASFHTWYQEQERANGTSMIVPVWISAEKSNEILTYALLDAQSDTTCILDDVLSQLQNQCDLKTKSVRLSLSTMQELITLLIV